MAHYADKLKDEEVMVFTHTSGLDGNMQEQATSLTGIADDITQAAYEGEQAVNGKV